MAVKHVPFVHETKKIIDPSAYQALFYPYYFIIKFDDADSISCWSVSGANENYFWRDHKKDEFMLRNRNIAIVQPSPPSDIVKFHYGDSAGVFRTFLEYPPEIEFSVVADLLNLPSPGKFDGIILKGSKRAAYEREDPEIQALERFVLDAVDRRIPIVGFCFGHQLLAQVMGGTVQKMETMGIGIQPYNLTDAGQRLFPGLETINLVALHNDQVVKKPRKATVILKSAFCPYAGFQYEDFALSFQPHPEISRECAREMLEKSQSPKITGAFKEAAIHSLNTIRPDSRPVADLVRDFLCEHVLEAA